MKSYLRFGTCAAVVGAILVSACPANADLVHWYKFDDTGSSNYSAVDSGTPGGVTGTLADTSITRGYQTNGGALWTSSGKVGGALEFIGANNNAVGTSDGMLGSSYTVAAWIKASSFAGENLIFDQYDYENGRFLFEVRGGKLGVFEGGGAGAQVGSTTLSTDTWYHVAVTNSNKAVTLYLNGNVEKTATFTYNAPLAGSNDIGGISETDSYDTCFDGLIDDVRIYNTALSQGEIQSLAAPEPSTLMLLVCGLLGLAVYAWRKRK